MDFKLNRESTDYHVNIRIITFVVTLVFLIVMFIYCIRIYASKKQNIMYVIRTEAELLANVFATDLNYSSYFLNIVTRKLGNYYMNLQYIQRVLQDYGELAKFNTVFGWRKYSWVDVNFREVVTSAQGIIAHPRRLDFMQTVTKELSDQEQIMFYMSKTTYKNDSLKLIAGTKNTENNKYVGYMILSYDIATIIRRLNTSKENHTNFVILDNKNTVIVQSQPVIHNIINNNGVISTYLNEVLERIDFFNKTEQEIAYLDVLSGVNYYIKKIKNLPFILIVNLDDDEIKNNILDDVIKKFLEVSVFVSIFLLIVISIYRRETYLREKAEQATIAANLATKAKSDFLAFTAHEIRSPLGFITTGSEAMIKQYFGPLSDTYCDYAKGIHQSAEVILKFITDILDENQIIEGKFQIVNDITSITKILETAIYVNQARADKKKIKINLNIMDSLPKLICDSRRMIQVMNNLLSNAIKYSNEETIITVDIKVISNDLVLDIIDQGIGMTEEEIKIALSNHGIILKKNHNLIDSYGLGLPIVKMLLDAHEAIFLIKSQPNVGTKVTIIFPKYKLVYDTK
ncbi:HAMP domain-containing histidine kinase [Candidatus Trichorickettsia mobilis]|uniref:histidine kinase n=2 Tax=Candidatus Trichorickettsia mobilis TaxID=1346319 RepID=A0ABZ0UW58_9RICK|nr:HAMP domain-containing histidine kinase [Candidatus Trichorickettsia mobilis]